jgi:predicted nucleic acid-binding protein
MTSSLVVFDTSIFIDHLRTGRYRQRIAETTGLVRNSAVVLAELSRGATNRAEQEFVEQLARNHPILTPTQNNWLESGRLLSKIRVDKGFHREKLRDLHFDLLIALTARTAGARLVTCDRGNFELIASYRSVQLEIW